MRLTVELVPRSCLDNLRTRVKRREWERIRQKVIERAGHRCEICGRSNVRLACHEVWYYDDKKHVQRLVGFVALCPLCHFVKHIGRAGALARAGRLDYWRVVGHYCQINRCSVERFRLERENAFRLCHERNRHVWTVEIPPSIEI